MVLEEENNKYFHQVKPNLIHSVVAPPNTQLMLNNSYLI